MKKLTLTLNVADDFDTGDIVVRLSEDPPVTTPQQPVPNQKPEKFRMEIGPITVTQTAAMSAL